MPIFPPEREDGRGPTTTFGATLNQALRLIVPALITLVACPASAGEYASLKEEIATARHALVVMITQRDKRGPVQQKLVKDTADAVSAHFAKLKAPSGRAAEYKELKGTWEAFKKTREKELVPAVLLNDRATYEKIGAGIQKERLDRMYALIAILEK
jgi:hypothetical protein